MIIVTSGIRDVTGRQDRATLLVRTDPALFLPEFRMEIRGVQRLASLLLVFFLASGAPVVAFGAQTAGILPEHNSWARFKPGAWKLVRVVAEELDENGLVSSTSITETKTTLVEVDEDGVTLEISVTVDVAGKRLEPAPRMVKQGFHGEQICKDISIKDLGPSTVTIENRKIPIRVIEIKCPGPTASSVTKIFYSPEQAPYILRRKSITLGADGKKVLSEMTVEVTALDMPWKIGAQTSNAAVVRAVNKHERGTVTILAFTSTDMPGGILSHTRKELDKNQRVIRRNTLELLDYGLEAEEDRSGLFGRRRSRKTKTRTLPR